MLQLILESKNKRNLELIQELSVKLNIHCRFILPKDKIKFTEENETDEAIRFVKKFTQNNTSFGDALTWQKSERQERLLS